MKLSSMRSAVEGKFSDFFEGWVSELEELVKHLLLASREPMEEEQEPHLHALVSKLTSHLKLYYTVKWAHAQQDVLAFFSPTWLTPLETAYAWITGWKPSMAFRLIVAANANDLLGLSPEQVLKIEQVRVKMKAQEGKVDREMERQQMAMADQHMVELSRRRRNRNGEAEGLVDVAIKALLVGLERIMKAADCVRLKTLKEILEVLTPLQCVRFLAAISLIQIRLRQWGHHPNSAAALQKYNPS